MAPTWKFTEQEARELEAEALRSAVAASLLDRCAWLAILLSFAFNPRLLHQNSFSLSTTSFPEQKEFDGEGVDMLIVKQYLHKAAAIEKSRLPCMTSMLGTSTWGTCRHGNCLRDANPYAGSPGMTRSHRVSSTTRQRVQMAAMRCLTAPQGGLLHKHCPIGSAGRAAARVRCPSSSTAQSHTRSKVSAARIPSRSGRSVQAEAFNTPTSAGARMPVEMTALRLRECFLSGRGPDEDAEAFTPDAIVSQVTSNLAERTTPLCRAFTMLAT